MAPENEKAETAEQKMAAAMQEVIDQSLVDILRNVKETDLIGANPQAETVRGNAAPCVAWMDSPCRLRLLSLASKRLLGVAEKLGMQTKQVNRIWAKVITGTKLLVIKPLPDNDRTGFTLAHYDGQSSGVANLYDLLAPLGLTVESGMKERYEVFYVPDDSPLAPALVLNLGKFKERRKISQKKEEGEGGNAPGTEQKANG